MHWERDCFEPPYDILLKAGKLVGSCGYRAQIHYIERGKDRQKNAWDLILLGFLFDARITFKVERCASTTKQQNGFMLSMLSFRYENGWLIEPVPAALALFE